jgi:hypothetical protein
MLELLAEPALGDRSTAELARALSHRIREGRIDPADPRLLGFLRRSADRKLAIDNPRYRPVPVERGIERRG